MAAMEQKASAASQRSGRYGVDRNLALEQRQVRDAMAAQEALEAEKEAAAEPKKKKRKKKVAALISTCYSTSCVAKTAV